jgi:hypothetical protein
MARVARPLAACIAVAAIAVALPSVAASQETLRLVRGASLELAGRGFDAGERVRVRVDIAGERTVRRVRASRSGAFRAAFPGLHFDPCAGMSAVATGAEGSRASLKRAPRECPPPGGAQQGEPGAGGGCGPPETAPSLQQAGKRAQPACPPN